VYQGLPTGTGLGKYRILERLWTTHNAVVYKARDATLDRLVTIKQMSPSLMDNPIACGHFRREAQFLARVPKDARHVVHIHELIEDELGLFIVEEHVPGHWLESLIAKRHTDLAGAIRVLKTAALGVRTLHALDLMHRGVHPGNIIVGRNYNARIANLATAVHEGDTTPPPTIVPKYTAPELLLGKDYDNRLDIYSLGLSIYEFCVGRRELHRCVGEGVEEAATALGVWNRWHRNLAESLPEACELNPLVPAALSSILRRMTAKRLEDRCTSIQEVLDVLARHLEMPPGDEQLHLFGAPGTAQARPARSMLMLGFRPDAPPSSQRPSSPLSLRAPSPPAVATSRHTVRQAVQPPPQAVASPAATPTRAAPIVATTLVGGAASAAPPSAVGPAPQTARARSLTRPRRLRLRPPPMQFSRPPQPQGIPVPKPVAEVHRPRQPYLAAWIASVTLFAAGLAAGGTLLWQYYTRPGIPHPLAQTVAGSVASYERGEFDLARSKLLEALHSAVDASEPAGVREKADLWLRMTEAQLALARGDFDEAMRYAHEAERRGMKPSEVAEFEQLCWVKKDAYRLEAEGTKAVQQGRFAEAEAKSEEYRHKAQATGLDPAKLEDRLQGSRADQKYQEAVNRTLQALEQGDLDRAFLACNDAERVRTTSETRKLRQRINDAKERTDHIARGDEAMHEKAYDEAAAAYERAARIEATPEVERKARTAHAHVLLKRAQEAMDKGDLLAAQKCLESSMWKFPTPQAQAKLLKLSLAFEAAKLVAKADDELSYKNFAEAEQLYNEALPRLPPPADAIVREKLLHTQQGAAVQRGDNAFQQGDWPTALQAYEEAKDLGGNGEVLKKIELVKAKLPP
jgi:serine/threonine protein kinase/tetratricopeptide (TPR) repeat protein